MVIQNVTYSVEYNSMGKKSIDIMKIGGKKIPLRMNREVSENMLRH